MARITTCIFVIIISFSAASDNFKVYDGYKVYVVEPPGNKTDVLINLEEHLDFWTPIREEYPSKVMVSPEQQKYFTEILDKNGMPYHVSIRNVAEMLYPHYQEQYIAKRKFKLKRRGDNLFNKYLRVDEINVYLKKIENQYPNLVTLTSVGKSTEGREMNLVKISSDKNSNKPIILVDAGIHAREWIAPATAVYLIYQLVENKKNQNLLKYVDWYILPSVNPDGYEYSHTNMRLWRKNRRKGEKCYGVDVNRNFDYLWGMAGTSSHECSSIYRGPQAFSEIEAQNFRNFTTPLKDRIILHLTLHSYGRFLLYPYGHSSVVPNNVNELKSLGDRVAKAMTKKSKEKWTVGNSEKVMYAATGATEDWMMGKLGVKLAYCMELQDGDKYEFELPADHILSAVKESFIGFKVFHDYVVKNYVKANGGKTYGKRRRRPHHKPFLTRTE